MRLRFGIAAATALVAAPLAAQDPLPPPPPSYAAVAACRTVATDAERLACYDRSVGALAAAVDQREVVITDRAAVREARRGLFGLKLPSLRLFGGGAGDEEVSEINSTLAAVRAGGDGPVLVLADGARWRQIEGRDIRAKAGTPVRIRRGAIGGYVAEVKGYPWARVTRLAD